MRGTVVLALIDTHADEWSEHRPVTIGTLPALGHLRTAIEEAGFAFVRLSELPSDAEPPLYVLWDFGSCAVLPGPLSTVPPDRVIAWTLESPLVAHRAFHRLDAIRTRSRAVLTFPGAGALLDPDKSFRPLLYPNEDRPIATEPPWTQRDFLVLISSNKSVGWDPRSIEMTRPYRSARRVAAALLAKTYGVRGKWTVPDLYMERLRAIEHFSKRDDFSLFGAGWGSYRGGREAITIRRRYMGPLADKHEALRRFRFALCFENTRFPGYITEKLFDCLYAGTIPIYRGAPDIHRYVPSNVFIDADAFDSYADLARHLEQMQPSEAHEYLSAATSFLTSDQAAEFSSLRFVNSMLTALEEAAAGG